MSAPQISPLAEVHRRAELGDNVRIGPFCVVGPEVRLGPDCVLESHVAITGRTTIGARNVFYPQAVIGAPPQDLSYHEAPTELVIGDDNVFRECVTVNRGAEKEDHVTRIGNANLFMACSHVAHNCVVGNHVILVNAVLLGGHVHVHDRAVISGNSVVHHFSTVGTLAFVGGHSRVSVDVPPYMMAVGGDGVKIHTVNVIGLQRRGVPASTISALKRAHRLLFREFKSAARARAQLESELERLPPEVDHLLEFLEAAAKGRAGRAGELRRAA